MKRTLILLLVLTYSATIFAQKESADVNKGNKLYNKEKYVEAEVEYRKGIDKNSSSFSANYDLGNALYRQEKYPEAAAQFQKAAALAGDDKKQLADAYHNMGNSLLNAQEIEKSIEAYKQALRNNPTDDETRYNLAYAKQMLQQQQQNQQNQDQQQQEQEQQEQKQDQQQQQQNQQQQNQQQQEQQEQQEQEQRMSKENAEQILQALQQDEKETQDKVKQQQMKKSKRYRVEKNW